MAILLRRRSTARVPPAFVGEAGGEVAGLRDHLLQRAARGRAGGAMTLGRGIVVCAVAQQHLDRGHDSPSSLRTPLSSGRAQTAMMPPPPADQPVALVVGRCHCQHRNAQGVAKDLPSVLRSQGSTPRNRRTGPKNPTACALPPRVVRVLGRASPAANAVTGTAEPLAAHAPRGALARNSGAPNSMCPSRLVPGLNEPHPTGTPQAWGL